MLHDFAFTLSSRPFLSVKHVKYCFLINNVGKEAAWLWANVISRADFGEMGPACLKLFSLVLCNNYQERAE